MNLNVSSSSYLYRFIDYRLMRIYKLMPVLSAFLLAGLVSRAQYTNDDGGIETKSGYLRYFEVGAGAAYQNLYDEAISPVLYWSVGPAAYLGHLKVSATTHSELNIQASSISLNNRTDEFLKTSVKTQRAYFDYRFLLKMPVKLRLGREPVDVKAGAILSGMFAYKNAPHLVDASKIYETVGSFGLSGRISRELYMWDKTCFISWDVSIPFLAYVIRPGFLNIQDDADPDYNNLSGIFDNGSMGSFGKFFRLNSRVSYLYRLENGNALKFGYQWDYFRIKTINKAFFAEHTLFMAFMFQY